MVRVQERAHGQVDAEYNSAPTHKLSVGQRITAVAISALSFTAAFFISSFAIKVICCGIGAIALVTAIQNSHAVLRGTCQIISLLFSRPPRNEGIRHRGPIGAPNRVNASRRAPVGGLDGSPTRSPEHRTPPPPPRASDPYRDPKPVDPFKDSPVDHDGRTIPSPPATRHNPSSDVWTGNPDGSRAPVGGLDGSPTRSPEHRRRPSSAFRASVGGSGSSSSIFDLAGQAIDFPPLIPAVGGSSGVLSSDSVRPHLGIERARVGEHSHASGGRDDRSLVEQLVAPRNPDGGSATRERSRSPERARVGEKP